MVQKGNSNLRRERPYTPKRIDSNTRAVLLTGHTEGRDMAISDSAYGYNYYNNNQKEVKGDLFISSNIFITRFGKDAFLELNNM